jgi:hypothetical protein
VNLGRPRQIQRRATDACAQVAADTPEVAAHGGGSPARHGKGAPDHDFTWGLHLHEARTMAKLTKSMWMRNW